MHEKFQIEYEQAIEVLYRRIHRTGSILSVKFLLSDDVFRKAVASMSEQKQEGTEEMRYM